MDIQTIAKKAEPILRKNRVSYAAIFGSRARGEERPDSDLDILVRLPKGITLFGLARIQIELGDALEVEVDLVPEGSFKKGIKENVEPDLKTIYGKK